MIFGLRKRIAKLENKIAVMEFEKEHPSGYALSEPTERLVMIEDGFCEREKCYDLLFIKDGKIQKFALPAVITNCSAFDAIIEEWRLDQERLLRVRTTTKYRNAFADVEETTEIYTFDKRELMLIKHFSETTTEDKSTQKKGGKK